jgi:predicted negative regulator of RcsB-dependent stress response
VTHPAAFDGLYADLKGDVLSAQGKNDEARTAYQLAYDKTDAKNTYRQLIQMKLDDLGAGK